MTIPSIERQLQGAIMDCFEQFKSAELRGEFDIHIRAQGSSGSREVKITYEADVGPWGERGTAKGGDLHSTFEVALQRAQQNIRMAPKALTFGDSLEEVEEA